MNKPAKINRLEEAHHAYLEQRAQDKYAGKVEGAFSLEEFRKCADYLAGVVEHTPFDAEDIGDMVRVALSMRRKAA